MQNVDIYIKNKQPIPCIYNVKQYTNSVDSFTFFIAKDVIDFEISQASVVTSEFTRVLTAQSNDDYIVLEWVVGSSETAVSGNFDVQVVIEGADGEEWRSYMAAFVVSESVDGGGSTGGSSETIGYINFASGVIDEGVIGEADDLYATGIKPMPYSDGLVGWFDFTDYAGEEWIENAAFKSITEDGVYSDEGAGLTAYNCETGDSEILIPSGSDSYVLGAEIGYTKGSFCFYMIFKADEYVNSTACIFANSYSASSGNLTKIVSYSSGCVRFDGYSSYITSTVPTTNYNVVVLNADSDGISMYVNGELIGSTSSYNVGTMVSLGCNNTCGSTYEFFTADLRFKMLAIFDQAQSEEEIVANSEWLYEQYIGE